MKRTSIILSTVLLLCSCGSARVASTHDDEVVNLGYTKESRRNSTSATSHLELEEKDNPGFNNMYEYLEGRVAGVVVTGDASTGNCSITIRGANSINMNNEPLILLDGQEISDLMMVSPNDVASVDVLKDASSTAIYGSRGANGVILITTKKPE